MSILITGMKMPKEGSWATVRIYPDGTCAVPNWQGDCTFIQGAQAVPVPPHGRLIDADAFIAEQRHLYCENCERRKGMKNGKMKFVYDIGDAPCRACGYGDVLDDLEDAPTMIEKEDGDNDV